MDSPHIVLSLMTWNIYSGADLTPLSNASIEQIPERVKGILRQFLATNFYKRAEAIARQIHIRKPDIIGLQEAALWELISPNLPGVTYDFIDILLNNLERMGLHYKVAALNQNFKATLPSDSGNQVRLTNQDVILIHETSEVKVLKKQEENFKTNLEVMMAGQQFTVLRGWSSIDACVKGHTFRMVNAHLEPDSLMVRLDQARELLAGPGDTKLPLVFIGDFNSNPNDSLDLAYETLISSGFNDIWISAGKGDGHTSFQEPDLLNAQSLLSRRVDLILFKEKKNWEALKARLVGEEQQDRTKTLLWPSNHAGIVGKLELKA